MLKREESKAKTERYADTALCQKNRQDREKQGRQGEFGEAENGENCGLRLEEFSLLLAEQEKAAATIEKYLRDVRRFWHFLGETTGEMEMPSGGGRLVCLRPMDVIRYKQHLQENYKISSVNSMLNALNCYLKFAGREDCRVRTLRQQRQMFCDEGRMLRRAEYERLVLEAEREGRERLCCILQTLGMTGIRVGELRFVTCESLRQKVIHISYKGKNRDIVLPNELIQLLRRYCEKHRRSRGSIFVTRNGRPVDRKNIWAEMKSLCTRARVASGKVFPHNLRHLFATAFYEKKKDLVRLADYLGHSSLETTRRYTIISSLRACQQELNLGLLVSGLGAGERTEPSCTAGSGGCLRERSVRAYCGRRRGRRKRLRQ